MRCRLLACVAVAVLVPQAASLHVLGTPRHVSRRAPAAIALAAPGPSELQALAALNGATLIWGSQHPVIKDVVAVSSPSATNAARFAIAALCTVPWLPGAPWRPSSDANATLTASTWQAGAELGCWSFLGFALQAIGLQTTTAARSAFLLYLNVKLVPLLALLLYGRQSPLRTWVSAAMALFGTTLLSFDGTPPNSGDAWCVASALASACFILRLEEAATEGASASAEELNSATLVCSATLCTLWAVGELLFFSDSSAAAVDRAASLAGALGENANELLYLAIVTTAGAQWLQTLGQSRVDARDAAVIYALDPCYAAGFSYLLLGETLGAQGLAGAVIVFAAVLVSRTKPSPTDETETVA